MTLKRVGAFLKQRAAYLQQVTQLRDSLKAIGIEASTLKTGDAEIGFLLPRSLFNNHLDELIKELRDIHRIIRAFSEATVGGVEEVEVRQISTSDPLFFFHLSVATIAAIGAAVTWALNTWKQVEEIRKVRADIQKTEVLTEKEASEIFDKKITEKIGAAIEAKVNELAKDDGKPGRVKEQRADLAWALESIMAHVERGMIVEIRFLPPIPATADSTSTEESAPSNPDFAMLQQIVPQLVFPKMEGNPILKIPAPPRAVDPT